MYAARFQFIHQIDCPAAVFKGLALWGANTAWVDACPVPADGLAGAGLETVVHPASLGAVIAAFKRVGLGEKGVLIPGPRLRGGSAHGFRTDGGLGVPVARAGRRAPGAGRAAPGHDGPAGAVNRNSHSPYRKGVEQMIQENEKIAQAVKAMADREGKYLTFTLAGEEYGIGILKIKEIIGMMAITSVPQTPEFIKGVINLRGKVIPVMDLRLRFGMPAMDYTERTCIIVVEINGGAGTVQVGVVVDAVSEVLNIKADDIEPTPSFGTRLNTDFILGMAKMNGGIKILLDINRVLSSEETALLAEAA